MKQIKIIKKIFILICFLTLFIHVKFNQIGNAKVLSVDLNSSQFNKIQYAVENASDGDIIFVYNGVYNESIVINKLIKLIGEDRNDTIIDGKIKNTTILITAENVTIENFTIQNNRDVIESVGVGVISDNNVIRDNIIQNCRTGIILQNCKNNLINNNKVSSNIYGIGLKNSIKNIVYENFVNNNINTGIYSSDGTDNTIRNNTVFNHTYGIAMSFENSSTIINNIISKNINQGINIYSCENVIISSNSILNNSIGVLLYSNCKNISIDQNLVTKSTIGIYLSSKSSGYKVNNNMFSDVDEKIHFEEEATVENISLTIIIFIIMLLAVINLIIMRFLWKKKKL